MSWLSSLLGTDYMAPAQSKPLNAFLASLQDPNFGQQQLQSTVNATVQGALPDYLKNLGDLKEQNIRRGISTGDLGTSFEGDLTSAFQRNIANSVAGQAANMFGQRNDLLVNGYEDQLNREQAAQNAHQQAKSGLIGGILGSAGSLFGSYLGKPTTTNNYGYPPNNEHGY